MHADTLDAFAVIVALVFLSPGPTLSLLSSAVSDRAPASGLAALTGACGAIATYAAAGLLILEFALAMSPAVFALLKTLGSCYLLWHGAIALYEAWAAPLVTLAPPPSSDMPHVRGHLRPY